MVPHKGILKGVESGGRLGIHARKKGVNVLPAAKKNLRGPSPSQEKGEL